MMIFDHYPLLNMNELVGLDVSIEMHDQMILIDSRFCNVFLLRWELIHWTSREPTVEVIDDDFKRTNHKLEKHVLLAKCRFGYIALATHRTRSKLLEEFGW